MATSNERLVDYLKIDLELAHPDAGMIVELFHLAKFCELTLSDEQDEFASIARTMRRTSWIGLAKTHKGVRPVGYAFGVQHGLDVIKIAAMGVTPAFRSRGIGTALIDKLIQSARVCEARWLQWPVREADLGAQLFSKHVGARAVGYTKDRQWIKFRLDVRATPAYLMSKEAHAAD